ncbi:MAG: hypothetical protein JSV43_01910, partial [Methanobacteriota archaeon]
MPNDGVKRTLDLSLLVLLAIVLVSYCFRGITSAWDGAMHLSKIRIMLENLEKSGVFPRWNPYWYFGVPMWRIYSPLSYYMMAIIAWIFHLSLLQTTMLWAYMAFSIAAVSAYLLALEMGLKRLGCVTSGLLFLTSFNLIGYWGIGSYPNVTGTAFAPVAMLLSMKAVKRRSLRSILAAGLAFGIVLLTYSMHAIFAMIFTMVISVIVMLREPSLLLVSRGRENLTKSILVLPKTLLGLILITSCVSMWWVLPFLTTYLSAPSIPGEYGYGVPGPPLAQLTALLGTRLNAKSPESPGVGHFMLGVIGFLIVFAERRSRCLEAPACFVTAFILCLSPWLDLPTGPLYWWRFTVYLSLFAAICGGIALDSVRGFYQELFDQNSGGSLDRQSTSKSLPLFLVVLILAVSVYPVVGSEQIIFPGIDMSDKLGYIRFLEKESNIGDRIGVERTYDLNVRASILHSDGGNVHYMYLVNLFAYDFWYQIILEKDPSYLRYFARNFNIRWLKEVDMDGVQEVYPEVYEVEGFRSSFAEVIGRETILALFVGDSDEYRNLFLSAAMVNPNEVIPVFGGVALDGFDLEALWNFDVVYLHGFRLNSEGNVGQVSSLLSGYVENGGGLILDTGDPGFGELRNIPEPFPVSGIRTYKNSHLDIDQGASHGIMANVDPEKIRRTEPYTISYALEFRNGSVPLLCEEDRPIVTFCERGLGKVLWTGLRLPYLATSGEDEEGAKLLVNMLRFAASTESEAPADLWANARVTFPNLDEISVEVRNASFEDAVWVKMSYYPGWTAS